MSLREISAWVMGAVMLITGAYYGKLVLAAAQAGAGLPPPEDFLGPAICAFVATIVVDIALAILAPKGADLPPDERERPMLWRAGHWAGLVQGGLAVAAVLYVAHSGDMAILFYLIVGGLILSQFVEYVLQIAFLRSGS
ncbi:MAG TPA: hypothetical protein PK913_05700 [Phenylobacterium sp.]|uniref:hypothetical protein n=1 Tax=Phenylobacterium sp. TaxID=1871053 RepID=UPI002C6F53D4|nr:hypothetical protein [Phenylobacterium sp.]